MALLLGAYGQISCRIAEKIKQNWSDILGQDSTKIIEYQNFFCLGARDKKNEDIIVCNSDGIIVGKLFGKRDYMPVSCMRSRKLITSHDISDDYWGSYISALFNKNTNTLSLLRDPLGLATAYYYSLPNGFIFSTDIAFLYDLLDQKPGIDWNHFVEFLLDENQALQTTPFDGIKELLPGVNYTIDSVDIRQELVWNSAHPSKHFISTPAADIEEGLFHELTSCTRAWARGCKGITVELSGGLDSSSVLVLVSSLVGKDIPIAAVHYNDSSTLSSQELTYAQEIARSCGVNLHVLEHNRFIDKPPDGWRPGKPSTFLMAYGIAQRLSDHAEQSGCPDIMSGQGGDHVFLAPPPMESLADYWLDHGLRGISFPLEELRAQYRTSTWQLTRQSVKAIGRYYSGNELPEEHYNENMFRREVLDGFARTSFYLNDVIKQYHPAKAWHIKVLSDAVAYADRNLRVPDKVFIHPFLSQPLVEYALRIPTYRTLKDNYNRYFLRKAVSRLTESQVIWRRSKGEVTASYLKALTAQFNMIRTLLKDGSLVKSGIISESWLDEKLMHILHGQGSVMFPFLRAICCQLWLNLWKL